MQSKLKVQNNDELRFVAKLLSDNDTDNLTEILEENASCLKLRVDDETAADVLVAYREKIKSVQQLLTLVRRHLFLITLRPFRDGAFSASPIRG